MTQLRWSEVEEWLDAHPDLFQDYFLRKTEIGSINAWLVNHGFLTIQDYARRGSVSPQPGDEPTGQRRPSRRCLRHEFARSKSRSVFRTHEMAPPPNAIPTSRRSSLKDMRKNASPGKIGEDTHCSIRNLKAPDDTLHLPSTEGVPSGCVRKLIELLNSAVYEQILYFEGVQKVAENLKSPILMGNCKSLRIRQRYGHPGWISVALNVTTVSQRVRDSLYYIVKIKIVMRYCSLPPNSIHMLSLLIESKVRLPDYGPTHSRSAKREVLRTQGEREFFLTIVRDVATELDPKTLSAKVVDNLAVLLDADGASLFLVDGPVGKRTLVSKVFDVHSGVFLLPGGNSDNEVQVPWGVGVLGHVAETGETVNLQIACEDPRFDDEVDRIMGYHTESLLCMAVRNSHEEIIAVAQVINKNPDKDNGHFTNKDEKLFETYLQFVGIALTNAQIVETSRQEYERNRNLLEIVHDLFEEQTSLEKVVLKIMQRAQRLLKCERAAVLLVDDTNPHEGVKFSKLFELTSPANGHNSNNRRRIEVGGPGLSGYLLTLAEKVAESGEVLNVVDCLEVEPNPGISLKSLLAMPIRNSSYQIIGVATIINKTSGHPFDENDEQLFEAFTIFCGLGIHNTIMYSEVEKAMARQKVTIEVLSYHATATKKEIDSLLDLPVPTADEWNLYSLSFDDFSLNEEEMILASVSMFLDLGLVKKFSIERETLYRFLMTVKKNYRDVPYHNWRHAFNVAQVMFAILMGCEMKGTFSDLEVLGMFVGCLCHDLDHRGTNNAFQQKAGSALVLLYGTTNTMEHHHFNHAVMILSSETLNIFSSLSAENYSYVMKILKHSILATDLSTYFQNRSKFFSLVERREYSWCQEEHRMLLCSVLMTASDIACSCKPWSVQKKVAYLVADEFLSQGDKEKKELKIQPIALMDRERAHELPQLQLKWIVDICLPLYQCLGTMNPKLIQMTEGAKENIKNWAALAEKLNKENEEYINNENKCSS